MRQQEYNWITRVAKYRVGARVSEIDMNSMINYKQKSFSLLSNFQQFLKYRGLKLK